MHVLSARVQIYNTQTKSKDVLTSFTFEKPVDFFQSPQQPLMTRKRMVSAFTLGAFNFNSFEIIKM